MSESRVRKRSGLAVVLSVIFLLALVMGPGPGIYLVNPVPGEPATRRAVLGMPIVYLWAISWFFVQLAVVIVAYCTLWSRQDIPDAAPPAPRDT
jgi:hypothetical protein